MSLIEQLKEVMSDHRGAAHISEITIMFIERFPHIQEKPDDLKKKIGSVLASDVKKTRAKSSFSKMKNKKGGNRKGYYRLKNRQTIKPAPTLQPTVTTQYTGKAGEAAVISELLFYGFNASAMAVDDGIDVVAGKNNKYFHIQVKTSNVTNSGSFGFTITKSSFIAKDSIQTFYIFVLRDREGVRYYNDYLILPSNQVRQLCEVGIIKDAPKYYSVRVQKDKNGKYLLNAKQDVTISINTFGQLA